MNKADDPVFPMLIPSDSYYSVDLGLTKRELFAAIAMNGYCMNPAYAVCKAAPIAAQACAQADHLLAALAAKGDV